MEQLPYEGVSVIEPELLLQEIESGRLVEIVDVRAQDECERVGWIAGARRFPLRQLRGRMAELEPIKHEPVVIVSTRGVSAHGAAAALAVAGFSEVAILRGGMARWLALGLPVRRSSSRPPAP